VACTPPPYQAYGKPCDDAHPCPARFSCVAFACGGALISVGKPATASSVEGPGYEASNAVDGDGYTRWSSAWSDPQWIQVDLGASYAITRVVLEWESAYGKAYEIQTLVNGNSWTSIYATSNGAGGTEDLTVAGTARLIRMYGTERATTFGYSLLEFDIYGY
jgi:hypothetical protein